MAEMISPYLRALYIDPWPPVLMAPIFSTPSVIVKILAMYFNSVEAALLSILFSARKGIRLRRVSVNSFVMVFSIRVPVDDEAFSKVKAIYRRVLLERLLTIRL